ncbi:MAG: Hsp20/alpha crystallin family protein [Proteobacteria bacterium]|nr:Hsp20/alpha crystallin family protein [Pseudomonadota bacterium]
MECNKSIDFYKKGDRKMLTRYYDSIRTPVFSLFDPFKVFNDFETSSLQSRLDSIDEEGIKVELPGVKAADVDVTVEGRTLKVSGKSRHGKEFSYVYNLRSTVDESGIIAKLEDGLLSISLPKKKESSARKIQVSG